MATASDEKCFGRSRWEQQQHKHVRTGTAATKRLEILCADEQKLHANGISDATE